MTNDLRILKKELKSFAKRVKDFKYTDSALIAFLITGIIMFSAISSNLYSDEIKEQQETINTSILQLRKDFKRARSENNKLLKDTNLELIQLMEQGDQAIKSPWPSFQFGSNFSYSDWKGTYKGRGDKKSTMKYERSDKFGNYVGAKQGTTSLKRVIEPISAVPVDAAVRPKNIDKVPPAFTVSGANGDLPPFKPLVVKAPVINPKNVSIAQPPQLASLTVTYEDVPDNLIGYNKDGSLVNNSLLSQLDLTGGDFNLYFHGRGINYDYSFKNASEIDSYTPSGTAIHLPLQDHGTLSKVAFFGMGGKSSVTIPQNVTVNVVSNAPVSSSPNVIYYMGNRSSANTTDSRLIHRGTTNLFGSNILVVKVDKVDSIKGDITFVNESKITGFAQKGMYTDLVTNADVGQGGDPEKHIFAAFTYNNGIKETKVENGTSGIIEFYAPRSYGWVYTTYDTPLLKQSSINNGIMRFFGKESVGVSGSNGANVKEQTAYAYIELNKPIELYGDKSVGVNFLTEPDNSSNNFFASKFNVQIGGAALTTQDVYGNMLGGDAKKVENSIGINFDFSIDNDGFSNKDINNYIVTLKDNSKNSIAVRLGQAKWTFNDSATSGVTIGGEDNIGYLSDGSNNNNSLTYNNTTNNYKVTGKDAILFAAKGGGTLKVNNSLSLNATNVSGDGFTLAYSEGSLGTVKSNVTLDKGVTGTVTGKDAVLYYAKNDGKITITETAVTQPTPVASGGTTVITDTSIGTPRLTVSGKNGVGFYATSGGKIDAKNSFMKLSDGLAGAFSDMGTSNIDLTNSILDYNGSGYSVYSKSNGKINLSGATIVLRGKSIGLQGSSLADITTNANTKIVVMSNDAIPFEFKNKATVNVTSIDTDLGIGTINVVNGQDATKTYTDYKKAFVDGISSYNINTNIMKNLAANIANETTDSFKFTKRYLIQRAKMNLLAGNSVEAYLNKAELDAIGGPQAVVGLDMSSSSSAASNNETQINLASGSTVSADRTDAGSGAIGLYTNFGKITAAAGSTVNVEKLTTNAANENAVGIYAVNGSEVENSGNVNVGGNKSIGILGLSYRQDSSGAVIGNEFGNAGEGKVNIVNKGTINADGAEAKGIFIKNNSIKGINQLHSGTSAAAANVAINDASGVIKLSGEKAVGIYADEATAINRGTIYLQGAKGQIGLYGTTTSGVAGRDSVLINDTTGKIKVGDSTLANNTEVPNIGIFTESKNQVLNNGTINVGENSYGIYAKNIKESGTSKLTVSKNGVGIFAVGEAGTPGNVTLDSGAKITVNSGTSGKEGVAVFTGGSNPVNVADNGSVMDLKDSSFGFVLKAPGSFVNTNTSNIKLANDTVYAYTDSNANIVNNAQIVSAGDRNYGIYGNGTAKNYGTIDFSSGNGNVGMYATAGGIGTNFGTIKVSSSNTGAKEYGVGMATGYYNEAAKKTSNEGTIINRGTIEVSKANTMGMYAVGANSKAINYGTINLSGRDTIGMYLDRGAHGENWGTIQTTVSGLRGVKGIYLANGSYIKNYGTINIAASDIKSAGIWADTQSFPNAEENSSGINPVTGTSQTGTSTPLIKVVTADDMKEMGGVTIKVPPRMTPVTVTDAQGNVIPIVKVDTNTPAPNPVSVTVTSPSGITTLDLALNNMQNFLSSSEATSLGMYVDTSGVNYTNPIQGLNNLVGLEDISLYFGTEASRYTTSKVIEVGDNILKPYNDALRGLVTAGTTLYVTSPSITWMAQPTKDPSTGLLDKVYLVKVPYVAFAKDGDEQTYNFLAGLEKRYGVEGLGTQEKLIFDKISSLTGGEGHILAQAFDEMKGHQYSNIQQRTKETGDILSSEFSYLQNEWENPTKNNSKMKAFGRRGEYKTDTAGVVDYTNNAYGVAYVYEKEGVTLGNKSGWYAGAVTNRYEFKDLGKSKEDQTMIKAGIFKTISPASDHNGSLTWTISGEAFAGINHMKRRYWIVDDAFEAKSNYATYGAALRNELGKDFRTSERTSIRPYGALNLEYGRYTGIKEYGPVALEIKGNDYISVQPEAGVSFNYRQPVGARSGINASLTAAYTNEIGEVNDVKNKAKLRGTDGPYYELRGDKENRKGSGKFDLNLGFENTRFGVTVNAGYDTKGENVRGGIGFRVIY